ncbi:MAG: adenosylcobinamide-GDP ribazoletransferase [Aquisalimonadaceae bacterium]
MNPRPLLLALAFLTRLPVRLHDTPEPEEYGAAVAMYPVVGLVLGLLLVMVAGLVNGMGGTPLVTAVVVVACWVGITGALHLDGLADTADAWLGGHGDRTRTLAIMKDPASGPMGVVALVLLVLLKVAAVASLLELSGWAWPLLMAPVLGRSACALLFLLLPYVRPGGLGAAAAATVSPDRVWGVVAAAVVLSVILAGLSTGTMMVIAAALLLWWAVRMMLIRLDGFTGDTAGATVEVVEAVVLLVACLMIAQA